LTATARDATLGDFRILDRFCLATAVHLLAAGGALSKVLADLKSWM
jgi:hypothetical protein